jgi:hypothetical protein
MNGAVNKSLMIFKRQPILFIIIINYKKTNQKIMKFTFAVLAGLFLAASSSTINCDSSTSVKHHRHHKKHRSIRRRSHSRSHDLNLGDINKATTVTRNVRGDVNVGDVRAPLALKGNVKGDLKFHE